MQSEAVYIVSLTVVAQDGAGAGGLQGAAWLLAARLPLHAAKSKNSLYIRHTDSRSLRFF